MVVCLCKVFERSMFCLVVGFEGERGWKGKGFFGKVEIFWKVF